MNGVNLLARCQDDQVVRGQLAAHYPQARIREVPVDEDPIFVHRGEQAWGMTLRADGPEYVPLRTFPRRRPAGPGLRPPHRPDGRPLGAGGGGTGAVPPAAALPGPRLVPVPPGPRPQAGRTGEPRALLHLPDQAPATGRRHHGRPGGGGAGRPQGLPVGAGRRIPQGVASGRRFRPRSHRGGLGLVALEAGPQPGLRPIAGAGEGLPHRLRRRAPGHRRAAGLDPAPAGRRTAGRGGRRLPPLRPPRRDAVQGEQDHAGGPPGQPAPRRSGAVRQAQRPGHPRGGRPVAPAGRGRRDAPGGAVRRQGAAALGQGSAGRRAGGRHHGGQAPAHPLPRGPAAPPPPLRGPHPHGQVHPDAPHRRPQDAGESRGAGRRRHCRRRSPRRPGGRACSGRCPSPWWTR